MRFRKSSFITWVVCLTMTAGCDTAISNLDVSPSDMQAARSEVIEEFFSDEEKAVASYRSKWNQEFGSSEVDVARKLVAAGQLMRHDKGNYERYYTYVKGELLSDSPLVQSLAVAALANASGDESVDLIVDRVGYQDSYVVAEAVSALEHRYDSANADPELEREEISIRSKAERLCSSEARTKRSQLNSFCGRLAQ